MQYLIDGCYGDGNVGDEALLRAVCYLIRSVDAEATFSALSSLPDETSRVHGISSIQRVNPIGRSVYGAVFKGQLWTLWHAMRSADCFILGGGELFRDDVGPRALIGMFYPLFLAKLLGKPVFALGVGAQRPTTALGRTILRYVLQASDAIVFRDAESVAIATELIGTGADLHWCPDLVFSMPRPQLGIACPTTQEKVIQVALAIKSLGSRTLSREHREQFLAVVIGALASFSHTHGARVQVLAFGKDDIEVSRHVSAALVSNGVPTACEMSCDIDRLLAIMKLTDIAVVMPLHASIFALKSGVPTIGLSYDLKVTKLYRHFGMETCCFALTSLTQDRLGHALESTLTSVREKKDWVNNCVRQASQEVVATIGRALAHREPNIHLGQGGRTSELESQTL